MAEDDDNDEFLGFASVRSAHDMRLTEDLEYMYNSICMPGRRPSSFDVANGGDEPEEPAVSFKTRRTTRHTFDNIMTNIIRHSTAELSMDHKDAKKRDTTMKKFPSTSALQPGKGKETSSFFSNRFNNSTSCSPTTNETSSDEETDSENEKGNKKKEPPQDELKTTSFFNISAIFTSNDDVPIKEDNETKAYLSKIFSEKAEVDSVDENTSNHKYFIPDNLVTNKNLIEKWEQILNLKQVPTSKFQEIIDLVHEGVPSELRGRIWMFLMSLPKGVHFGFPSLSAETTTIHDFNYQELIKSPGVYEEKIREDIDIMFKKKKGSYSSEKKRNELYNMANAYSKIDVEVGYSMGILYIAAVLLLYLDEEKAFQILYSIFNVLNLRNFYLQSVESLLTTLYHFTRIIFDRYSEVHETLAKVEARTSMFSSQWFLTLFSTQFHCFFVARFFDLLFLHGCSFSLRLSIALLVTHHDEMQATEGKDDLLRFLNHDLPNVYDFSTEQDTEIQAKMATLFQLASSIRISNHMLAMLTTEYHFLNRKMKSEKKQAELETKLAHINQLISVQESNLDEMKNELYDACAGFSLTQQETTEIISQEYEGEVQRLTEVVKTTKKHYLEEESALITLQNAEMAEKKNGFTVSLDKIRTECKEIVERVGRQCKELIEENNRENSEKLEKIQEELNKRTKEENLEIELSTTERNKLMNRINDEKENAAANLEKSEIVKDSRLHDTKLEHKMLVANILNEIEDLENDLNNWTQINKKQESQFVEISEELRDSKKEANNIRRNMVKENTARDNKYKEELEELKTQFKTTEKEANVLERKKRALQAQIERLDNL